MGFLIPEALLGLLALGLLILLSFFKVRPKKQIVPSLIIWQKIKERNPPLKELKRPRISVSLIIQMLAISCGIIAIAGPYLVRTKRLPTHCFFVFDTTASMQTIHKDNKTRLDLAKELSGNVISKLQEQDMVTTIYNNPSPVHFEGSKTLALKELEKISISASDSNFKELCLHAIELSREFERSRIWIFSDKQVDINTDYKALLGSDKSDNAGFVSFSLDEEKGEIFACIINNGLAKDITILLQKDNETYRYPQRLQNKFTSFIQKTNLKTANRIRLRIEHDDNLLLDNSVEAVRLPVIEPLKLLCTGRPDQSLLKALSSIPALTVQQSQKDEPADIIVYNETIPGSSSANNIVVVNPQEDFMSFSFGKRESVKDVNISNSSLFEGISQDHLKINFAREIKTNYSIKPLISNGSKPICCLYEQGSLSMLLFSFGMHESYWRFFPDFPIFWANYIDYVRERTGVTQNLTIFKASEPLTLGMHDVKINASHPEASIFERDGLKVLKMNRFKEYTISMNAKESTISPNLLDKNESENMGVYSIPQHDQLEPAARIITTKLNLDNHFLTLCLLLIVASFFLRQ